MSNKMNAVKKHLPKLRFPEFQNAPEWERKKLSELLFETKQRNRNLEYDKSDVLSVSGEYGIVNQIEFMGRSYAGVSVKDYHIVETGDIVYTKSPLKNNPFGIIKENKGQPGIVSTLYAVYRATNLAFPTYLDHYFSRDYNLNSYLQPIVRKGAKNDMKVNNFAVLGGEILIPKIDEQQKIADCLTSLDDLIAAQSKKVDSLQSYKKGLMQNLFPAEGESVPKLRFPEFVSAGAWEEKTINEVGEVITGNTPSTVHPEYYGGNRLFVSPVDISNQRYVKKTRTTLSEMGFSQARTIQANSILFVCIGSTIGKVAQNLYECATNQQINSIIPNSEYSNAFVYFNLEKNAKKISKLAGKQAVPLINKTTFASVAIKFPSLPEQQRIAELLSALDEQISAQSEAVAALKVHKKGLMQGLFPSMNEVQE